eukprot:6455873-Prymnesium_polylepis.1
MDPGAAPRWTEAVAFLESRAADRCVVFLTGRPDAGQFQQRVAEAGNASRPFAQTLGLRLRCERGMGSGLRRRPQVDRVHRCVATASHLIEAHLAFNMHLYPVHDAHDGVVERFCTNLEHFLNNRFNPSTLRAKLLNGSLHSCSHTSTLVSERASSHRKLACTALLFLIRLVDSTINRIHVLNRFTRLALVLHRSTSLDLPYLARGAALLYRDPPHCGRAYCRP